MIERQIGERTLIITHIDLDGFGCALLFYYFKYPFKNLIMADYNEYEDRENKFDYDLLTYYDKIIYADFTPDERSRNIIEDNGIECIIIDHHETQTEILEAWQYSNVNYIFDNEKCGTLLVFDWLKSQYRMRYPDHLTEMITYIDAYDLWKKETDEYVIGKMLNTVLYKYADWWAVGIDKHKKYIEIALNKIKNVPDKFFFAPYEQQLIKKEQEVEDKLFGSACKKILTRKDNEGHYFGLLKLNKKISAIASRILERYKRLFYMVIINNYKPKELKMSLRSREGFNLLEFENTAGHRCASGMTNIDNQFIEDLWSGKIYCLERKGD